MFPIGPITPLLIAEYEINKSTAGLLTSIIFLIHIVFAIPASTLVSKINLKTLIALAAFLGSVPVLSFLATDSFLILLLLRGIYGASFILLFPSIGALFMQWFPSKELPLINGLFTIACSIGMTISIFLVAPMSEAIGWEAVLSGFGAISLLSAILWFIFGKAQRIPPNDETKPITRQAWEVLRDRNTLLISAADAGPLGLLTVVMAWIPTFYHDTYGMSLTKGGTLMGFLSLSGIVALVLASFLSTKTTQRKLFLIVPGVLIGLSGLTAVLMTNSVVIYISLATLGFAAWFYIPALMTIPMELYSKDPQRVSLIFATLMSIGGIVSFVASPTVGAIADLSGSLVYGISVFAVMAWSLAIAGILLPETGTVRTKK